VIKKYWKVAFVIIITAAIPSGAIFMLVKSFESPTWEKEVIIFAEILVPIVVFFTGTVGYYLRYARTGKVF
jgi:hypothetical protein